MNSPIEEQYLLPGWASDDNPIYVEYAFSNDYEGVHLTLSNYKTGAEITLNERQADELRKWLQRKKKQLKETS